MQPLSLLPGTAADSDRAAVPLSLSASATVPDAKLSPTLAVVALNAAPVLHARERSEKHDRDEGQYGRPEQRHRRCSRISCCGLPR
jgi:hypothetical protein